MAGHKAVGAAAVTAIALGSASAASAETLTDALIMAYRNSHLLEQNRAVLRASDEDVELSMAALRPVIAFVAQGEAVNKASSSTLYNNLYGTLALTAQITLYDFGKSKFATDSAKETVLATQEALVNVEQQVLLSALTAYLDVRQNAQTVNIQQNNVNVLNQELKATQDKFDVGRVTKTDVAQAQAALAAAQASLVSARGQLQVARASYKVAVGAYPGKLDPPPREPAIPGSLEAAQSIARREHPTILQAQHTVAAAEYTVKSANAAVSPSITGGVQAGYDNKGNDAASATLTLTQPIYQGGQLSATYRQAAANRDSARAQQLQSVITVIQDVGNSWSQLQVARSSITSNQEQVRAAQVAFDGVREEAKFGSRTMLDVLTAEQTLLNARVSLLTAQTDQYLALYMLLSSMGLLTVDHLKLGVPQYDAAAYYNAVKNGPSSGLSPQGRALDRIMKSLGK